MSQQPYENPKTPVDRFFAAASTGLTQWWRWVVGVIVIAVFWLGIGGIPLLAAIAVCQGSSMEVSSPWFACAGGALGASLLPDLVLGFLGFAVGLIGIWIVVKRLHRKSLDSGNHREEIVRLEPIPVRCGCWTVCSYPDHTGVQIPPRC